MGNNRGAIIQKPCGENKGTNENDDPSRKEDFLNLTKTQISAFISQLGYNTIQRKNLSVLSLL